jgi:hypothetical protein
MNDYVPPNEVEENYRQNVVQNIDGNDSEPDEFHDVLDDMQPHMLEYMLDWESEDVVPNYKLEFALDLKKIESELEGHDVQTDQIKKDSSLVNALHMQEGINADLKLKLNYIRGQLAQEGGVDRRTVEHLLQQGNLWELQAQERWILYRYWVDRLRNILLEDLHRQKAYFHSAEYAVSGPINDVDILRESLIVGMTTTGAARCQFLLQALKAKIGK